MLPDNNLCTLLFSFLKKGITIRQDFAAGYEPLMLRMEQKKTCLIPSRMGSSASAGLGLENVPAFKPVLPLW